MSQIILGVDPGLRHTGWGVIEKRSDNPKYLAHGVISPSVKASISLRLAEIYAGLVEVMHRYQVQMAAMETVFVAGHYASALKLGQARGAALSAVGASGIECAEYTPTSIKKAVVGAGRAEKKQVGAMVCMLLGLSEALPADASDALAVAVCHCFTGTAQQRLRHSEVPL